MIALPKAIQNYFGDNVLLSSEVISVEKNEAGFVVAFKQNGEINKIDCDVVLSTIPAYSAGELFSKFDKNFKTHSDAIYYPPVLVYYLVYNKKDVQQPLDGFGFLIPEKEKKIFPWRSLEFCNFF